MIFHANDDLRLLCICFFSVLVGFLVALACALVLKHVPLSDRFQIITMFLCAYTAYWIADLVEFASGIVGVLVCGFAMKKYVWTNLADDATRQLSLDMFSIIASIAETFVSK